VRRCCSAGSAGFSIFFPMVLADLTVSDLQV
jgi:hypothetical protein